jgi:hypothetical protein
MLPGHHFMTPNQACNAVKDAAFTWGNLLHNNELDWDGIRRAMNDAISSPFIMRPDSEKHLQYLQDVSTTHLLCSYRTKAALELSKLLRDAALAEDRPRFLEHFYTALEL